MNHVRHNRLAHGVHSSMFSTGAGMDEVYLSLEAPADMPLPAALGWLAATYHEGALSLGLGTATLAFTRLFLRDVADGAARVGASPLWQEIGAGAVSLVEQRPLNGGVVALVSYHVRGAVRRSTLPGAEDAWRNGCVVEGAHYRMHWVANHAVGHAPDSATQTRHLLAAYDAALGTHGLSLRENTVRTWVYVRDIDNNYKGMADARREYFAEHGLDQSRRSIASTGIGGAGPQQDALVMFDALSVGGIREEQIVVMEAIDHMPPTTTYGVTFERGLRLRFGDRSHLYVSGTASIDAQGNVMHEGDAPRQAGRMLENVRALLDRQGASLRDLAHAVLYVRDVADASGVLDVVRPALPRDMPLIAVHGPVCRPAWLVEMEGVALIDDRSAYPAFL